MKVSIKREKFGVNKDGQTVTKYTLINRNGMSVTLLDIGAVIYEIMAPDREGVFENIVLGFDTVADYEVNEPAFGAVLGRCANRISDGGFTYTAGAKTEYAPFLEYGTRFMTAQSFVKPAFDAQKQQFLNDIEKMNG